jgi:hypothetical protein
MSPQVCLICLHPNRLDIESEIARGGAMAEVARNYSIPYPSLWRHCQTHMAVGVTKKQLKAHQMAIDDLEIHKARLEAMLAESDKKKTHATSLKILAELRVTRDQWLKNSASNFQERIRTLEEENAMLRSRDFDKAEESEFADSLKVLTLNELKMIQRIGCKLDSQDASDIIIPDPKRGSAEELTQADITIPYRVLNDQARVRTRIEAYMAMQRGQSNQPKGSLISATAGDTPKPEPVIKLTRLKPAINNKAIRSVQIGVT